MKFRIADTFTSSLSKLTNDEQKTVKTTSFDLQMNPANPGMQFHRIEKSKDKYFWSVRVTRDIRLIIHKTDSDFLLCYVGHHDDAYSWAKKRKIERHPKTGAAQLVEIRESVKEIIIPKYIEEEVSQKSTPLFAELDDDYLMTFGVPQEWLSDVKQATENSLFQVTEHLPQEAAEALLEIATGDRPETPAQIATDNPFEHPDAKRRFSHIVTSEELQRALDYPWEKWITFLHPDQESLVKKDFNGPTRISGSAGTGKTIVALHRAVYLLKKYQDSRVLLTTFSEPLANALQNRLRRIIADNPRLGERIDVYSANEIANVLYQKINRNARIASSLNIEEHIRNMSDTVSENKFSYPFIISEWQNVVDAWKLTSWDQYKDIKRLGRKKRLSEAQRKVLWGIFEKVREKLKQEGVLTNAEMLHEMAQSISEYRNLPYDFVVIDEAQDLTVPQLKFLASLGSKRTNGLFFTGDLGQRIFQQPFSWMSLGVDIRGRSHTLRVNYRTSHQIRSHADRLLPGELSDIDGNREIRKGTVSVFEGIPPVIQSCENEEEEISLVAKHLQSLVQKSLSLHEIGIFVRSKNELHRAIAATKKEDYKFVELDLSVVTKRDHISICPMHFAKGLEFKAVIVMACDDEVIPQQSRIETAAEESDLEEVYQTERHLLYVACTRARDSLLVTGVKPMSEFLEDLKAN